MGCHITEQPGDGDPSGDGGGDRACRQEHPIAPCDIVETCGELEHRGNQHGRDCQVEGEARCRGAAGASKHTTDNRRARARDAWNQRQNLGAAYSLSLIHI